MAPPNDSETLSKMPLVSVIMPAHNAAGYIQAAIESVRAQTYTNWELWVIDDASTDDTSAIVQAIDDVRIRYLKAEPIGHPAGVRNLGLQKATGDFIAFLDADDLYYPDSLQIRLEAFQQWPKLTAVYGFARYMDESGNDTTQDLALVKLANGTLALPQAYEHSWRAILTNRISCLLPGLMMRYATLKRVGLFNEALYGPEDYEYYVRLFMDNFEGVKALPMYSYRYRLHANSLTKTPEKLQRILESAIRIFDWIYDESPVAGQVQPLRSKTYTIMYHYFARERLLNAQPGLARRLVWLAFQSHHVSMADWLMRCLPVLLRSLLPHGLDAWLVSWRRQRRQAG